MKRSRVMQFLCCLSLMLCVTCSDLFSLKAFAYSNPVYLDNSIAISWDLWSEQQPTTYFYDSSGGLIRSYTSANEIDELFMFTENFTISNCSSIVTTNPTNPIDFDYIPDVYDYYILFNAHGNKFESNTVPFSFSPDGMNIQQYDCNDGYLSTYPTYVSLESTTYHFDDADSSGFSVVAKLPDLTNASITGFGFWDNSGGSIPRYVYFYGVILAYPVGSSPSDSDLAAVVSAIQEQTSDILNKFDEVLTPEGDHNFDAAVDNINDQINENMGALGFAHDTVTQFADLFTETPGAPVITVPPLKMSIKGQEYEFFHGYSYDFRSMETGPLAVLIGAVRTTGTISLWLAFLYYCNNEFNNFFRR